MTSFVRAYADHRGLVKDPASLKIMGGLLERAERLMLIYIGMALGIYDTRLIVMAVALIAVLANVTATQRVLFALNFPEIAKAYHSVNIHFQFLLTCPIPY